MRKKASTDGGELISKAAEANLALVDAGGPGATGTTGKADLVPEEALFGAGSALAALALLIIMFHWLIPTSLYTRLDMFSMNHRIKEGESPVKQRTPLGSAFTLAFVPIVLVTALALMRANRNVITTGLSLPLEAVPARAALFRIGVSSPFAFGNFAAGSCTGIRMESADGIACDSPATLMWDSKACSFEGRGCQLGQEVVISFKIPRNYQAAAFSAASTFAVVPSDGTAPSDQPAVDSEKLVVLRGAVASLSASEVLAGNTTVRLQSLATYVQDNATSTAGGHQHAENSNIRSGYQLSQTSSQVDVLKVGSIPFSSSSLVVGTSAWWRLKIQIERLPTALVTVITRGQNDFQLLAAILAVASSLFGIWRFTFKGVEVIVTHLQRKNKRYCRRRCCRCRVGKAAAMLEDHPATSRANPVLGGGAESKQQPSSGSSVGGDGGDGTTGGVELIEQKQQLHQGRGHGGGVAARLSVSIDGDGGDDASVAAQNQETANPIVGVEEGAARQTSPWTLTGGASSISRHGAATAGTADELLKARLVRAESQASRAEEQASRAGQYIREMRAEVARANERAAQADERAARAEDRLATLEAAVASLGAAAAKE